MRMTARLVAADLLKNVLVHGAAWDPQQANFGKLSEQECKKVKHYCFSVLRNVFFLENLLSQLMKSPIKKKDYEVHTLLLIGLYELSQGDSKEHAIVNESVESAVALKKVWAKGLLNAVLREFIRKKTSLLNADRAPQALYNHPQWFLDKLQVQWPEQWESMVIANNAHPPMTLRVNRTFNTRAAYLEMLNGLDIPASLLPSGDAIVLQKPMDVYQLPGFTKGMVSVQDLSAQIAAPLLELSAGLKVLDACAAPGGKTAHMLEIEPTLNLDAVDISPSRLKKVKQSLERLSQKARLIEGDASKPEAWWDGELYDRILIDAPCSGSGVVKRHPDIKLRSSPDHVSQAAKQQTLLLQALWPLLKLNGILVYSTCSVFQEENVKQMEWFLNSQKDAQILPFECPYGIAQTIGQQILTSETTDGFYYARIIKR